MTGPEIRKAVWEMDPSLGPADPAFLVACFLLAFATSEARSLQAIARKLHVSRESLRPHVRNLRRNGVIGHKHIYADWSDPASGGIAFWMDVSVGLGYVERAPAMPDKPNGAETRAMDATISR